MYLIALLDAYHILSIMEGTSSNPHNISEREESSTFLQIRKLRAKKD